MKTIDITTEELKEFEIWSEGFAITGNIEGAAFHAKVIGLNFKDVCSEYFKDSTSYNKERNTLWGCRIFDNETDARKSFG